MFCPNCRNSITENDDFCPYCGFKVKQNQISNTLEQPIQQSQNQETVEQSVQPLQTQNIVEQPVQQNPTQNIVSQPVQQTDNQNGSQMSQNKQSRKKYLIIVLIIILLLIVGITFGINKIMKEDSVPLKTDEKVDENNTKNNKDSDNDDNNNTSGTVDPNTNLTYDKNGAVLMAIEDVFVLNEDTVVVGPLLRGTIKLNDEVQIIGLDKKIITTTVTGIELSKKEVDSAEAGDNVGLILKDVSREEVERGQVVAKPNSIKASKKFEATVDFLSKEEGGMSNPLSTNSDRQFYFRSTDIMGNFLLLDNIKEVKPGDKNIQITVELEKNVAMEVGTEFLVRDGGRTIGTGKITKID